MQNSLRLIVLLICALAMAPQASAHSSGTPGRNYVRIAASDKHARTALANLGVAIDSVKSDSVYGTATDAILRRGRARGHRVLETFPLDGPRALDFPVDDERYHNYAELTAELDAIVAAHPGFMRKFTVGRTWQGRDIWAVQFNTSYEHYDEGFSSNKPGIVYMGNHHAREHLSAEIPLMFIKYLADNYGTDPEITRLVDTRDIFVIPMVNPDGVEYDLEGGRYKMHRKNMRDVGGGGFFRDCVGVDLNRNYSWGWGTGGSSDDPCSDVYMGPEAFSEPETQSIKAFIDNRPNLKVLLSFHTFSELILYPWGGSNDPIAEEQPRRAYETMAQTMAQWNGYTPEQSSDLYIATGDTCDWAWGTHGIFSFTFELSPKNSWGGAGFYPGADVIDQVFADNLRPALFLLDLADDPYRVLQFSNPLDDPRLMWLRGSGRPGSAALRR